MAAVVPIAAGVGLWLITGSIFALVFALLGPLMIAASLVDAARNRRRDRRQGAVQAEKEWADAEQELLRRHQEERDALWLRDPDAGSGFLQPPLRGVEPPDTTTSIVVGAGGVTSEVRCTGGEESRGRSFRERCSVVLDAPVLVSIGGGICVRGAPSLTDAVVRALVLQLCLRFGASQLALVGADLSRYGLESLPHAVTTRKRGLTLGIGVSDSDSGAIDALIWQTGAEADVPEGITTVIDVVEPAKAKVRTPRGITTVAVECLSFEQAREVVKELAHLRDDADALPDAVAMHELVQPTGGDGLAATIGRGERGDITVDIVHDGPHAIVTGMTGTGKSELLVSWVTAIAELHGPERVVFVLADFKGGTAFEPLRALRQVAAVVTDLDEAGARRGVSSLTAELRRREAALASAGVRDVRDSSMPRLVVVIDEFAALLAEHPDLGAVFIDVAARGRALGMHLILGTQRASGVVRDALAANCPLRISLRVGDAADSVLMLGTDAAAALPGGAASRGIGLVRRPTDQEPVPIRVALTGIADLREVGMRWGAEDAPHSPWLPALPARIPLEELPASDGNAPEAIVWGMGDDPARQSQPQEMLRCGQDRGTVVLGSPGSGRTSALRAVAAQRSDALWVSDDPEAAWDMLAAWAVGSARPPEVVLCDDLDALVATFPPEYGQQFVQRWEQVIRAGAGTTFMLSATRAAGAIGRVFELLPRRAILRMPTRVEHLSAGGEPSGFVRDRIAGRARIGEREVQIVWAAPDAVDASAPDAVSWWAPSCAVTAVVSAGAPSLVSRLREAHPEYEVLLAGVEPSAPQRPCIVVADAETWQRNWSLFQRIRAEGEVLIRAEQQADLRQLGGVRELPPYALLHRGRAWSITGASAPRRVVLAELSSL